MARKLLLVNASCSTRTCETYYVVYLMFTGTGPRYSSPTRKGHINHRETHRRTRKVRGERHDSSSQYVATSSFGICYRAGRRYRSRFAFRSAVGEDTRELLRGTAQDGIDDAVDRGKTVIRRVRKNIGDAKDFVSEVADTAEGAFREARNALS